MNTWAIQHTKHYTGNIYIHKYNVLTSYHTGHAKRTLKNLPTPVHINKKRKFLGSTFIYFSLK